MRKRIAHLSFLIKEWAVRPKSSGNPLHELVRRGARNVIALDDQRE